MIRIFGIVVVGMLISTASSQDVEGKGGTVSRAAMKHPTSQYHAASQTSDTMIGLQYELYFTKLNVGWETSQASGILGLDSGTQEAIPILGKYSSLDSDVIKKHEEWFEYLGIDWLLIDWTSFLLPNSHWERHEGASGDIEKATELLLKTYRQLEVEGKHPPKIVFMLFQNGQEVPDATQRTNSFIQWATTNFLDKPEYKNLWLYYNGKPLLTFLYPASLPCNQLAKSTRAVTTSDWTVRWMGSQLQDSHVNRCGYWSWMDATIRQEVTFKDRAPEETVVTPSSFPYAFTQNALSRRKGWLDPKAIGRDHGAPHIESWKVAFETRPKFIQIHQWNEFGGQKEGIGPHHDIYADEYNLELSDDIEPTQPNKCAYRGCGGWGYYYVNLTKALISLYRRETPDITIMALSGPSPSAVVRDHRLLLTWQYLGKAPTSYTLKVDGQTVTKKIMGTSYNLDLSKFSAGRHTASLTAIGVHTYFDLAPEHLATKSSTPLPVTSEVVLDYSPTSPRK